MRAEQERELAEAEQFAATNSFGFTLYLTNAQGEVTGQMVGMDGEVPRYLTTYNLEAAGGVGTTNLWPGGLSGFALDGAGSEIALWDQGIPRLTHVEFTTNGIDGMRVVNQDDSTELNNRHATHVAGTLGGYGVDPEAKGMAPRIDTLRASDWEEDFAEMSETYMISDYLLSNHSYGDVMGWGGYFFVNGFFYPIWYGDTAISVEEDYQFGRYQQEAQCIDQLAWDSATTCRSGQPATSAGQAEDRLGIPVKIQRRLFPFSCRAISPGGNPPPNDGNAGSGYDALSAQQVAKNALVVGAVDKLPDGYSGPESVQIGYLSSFGPTDDGRIKPDVCGVGIGVYSAFTDFDQDYRAADGTSMASPNVAGSLALVGQLFEERVGNRPLASPLRGLAIHTAREAGDHLGPDYRFGWGLFDAEAAAELVADNFETTLPFLKELFIEQGQTVEFPITASTNALKVTLCWTDPPGDIQPAVLDPTNRVLRHDMDLRLIASDGTEFLPWVLDRDHPEAPATTGDNCVDNVEQVCLTNAVAGASYTLRISSKAPLTAEQPLSLLLSGVEAMAEPELHISHIVPVTDGLDERVALAWPALPGRIYRVERRNDLVADEWLNISGEISAVMTNIAVEVEGYFDQRFYRVKRRR